MDFMSCHYKSTVFIMYVNYIVKLRSRSIPYHISKNLKESLRISENDSLLDQEHKL